MTTAAGLYVLQDNFRTIENQFDAEAHDSVRSAALAIRNQIRFYQGILQLISRNPDVSNLLKFGEHADIVQVVSRDRTPAARTLSTALTSPQGVVFGDPLALCVSALRASATCNTSPPVVRSTIRCCTATSRIRALRPADRVSAPSGESAAHCFVSFRLDILKDILDGMSFQGDRFVLLRWPCRGKTADRCPDGTAATSELPGEGAGHHLGTGPSRAAAASSNFFADLVVADLAILIAVSI